MLSEISQAVKDKYHMISPISGTLSSKIFANFSNGYRGNVLPKLYRVILSLRLNNHPMVKRQAL